MTGERKVLAVLAQYPEGRTMSQIALLSGYRQSGGFRNILSSLRTEGWMVGANKETMRITDSGLAALGDWNPLPAGPDLFDYWIRELSGRGGKDNMQTAVLRALYERYPDRLNIAELAEITGYEMSGGFRNVMSELRTLELIEGTNQGGMKAADILFE